MDFSQMVDSLQCHALTFNRAPSCTLAALALRPIKHGCGAVATTLRSCHQCRCPGDTIDLLKHPNRARSTTLYDVRQQRNYHPITDNSGVASVYYDFIVSDETYNSASPPPYADTIQEWAKRSIGLYCTHRKIASSHVAVYRTSTIP